MRRKTARLELPLIAALFLAVVCPLWADPSQFFREAVQVASPAGVPGGIASDGTNHLIAARDADGAICLLKISPESGAEKTYLGRTGETARIAFDGVNYLIVWPDRAEPPADLYGQFVSAGGSLVGSPFLIEPDVQATETGGLEFAGTNYLVVWESRDSSNGVSSIRGRRITATGTLLGERLQISDASTTQKYPTVAASRSAFLVSWVGCDAETNRWHVMGRRISREGVLMNLTTISEIPAREAWPAALASDGTNWLSVWSRETGPYPMMSTNAMVPTLFGRLLGADGAWAGPEREIRRGMFGQFQPAAAFDGKNYVVAWLDRRIYQWLGQPYQFSTRYLVYVRQIDRMGVPFLPEWRWGYPAVGPRKLVLGRGADRVFVATDTPDNNFVFGTWLIRPKISLPVLRNFQLLTNGKSQFDLESVSGGIVGVQTSTNLADWTAAELENASFPSATHFPGRVTVSAPPTGSGDRRFFRAYDGATDCVSNLRLMQQVKDQWALDFNHVDADTPALADLFGPSRYLPQQPVCPFGGTYTLGLLKTMPLCSLGASAGHTY